MLLDSSGLGNASALLDNCKQAGSAVTFELAILTKSKDRRIFLWSVYWSKAEASLFCIAHDVTERKRLELKKASFLKMISSDLKIPLISISGSVRNILSYESELSKVASAKFLNASKNVNRLIGLV